MMIFNAHSWLAGILIGGSALSAQAQILFQDDFDSDSSADWTVLDATVDDNPSDFTVDFAFDYSQHGIPPAPNSTGDTTSGVKMTVNNNDDVGSLSAVNIYPNGQSFSGNYALRFDMWINYNGGPGGGSGSTEFALAGINHTGTTVNWTDSIPNADGLWFAVTGEGGAGRDYRSYQSLFEGADSVELLGEQAGLVGNNHPNAVFQRLFSSPPFESPGAPGKQWVRGEVRQVNDDISWVLNGQVVAFRPNISDFITGNIMIGYMDIFSSIANPAADNFILFDNVQVVNLNEEPLPPQVTVEAIDGFAAEPGDDTGEFQLFRTGDLTEALTVDITMSGTATAGEDYEGPGETVTFEAGSALASVTVTVLDDDLGEAAETILLGIDPGTGYEVGVAWSAEVTLEDDGDPVSVGIAATDASMSEGSEADIAVFTVTRMGDTTFDLVVNVAFGGSAESGVDYLGEVASVTIVGGLNSTEITVTPLEDDAFEGDETVEISVVAGDDYVVGDPSSATAILTDNDQPVGDVQFAADFNTDVSGDWTVNRTSDDTAVVFAYDYSADGIPPAPNSTDFSTIGVKFSANMADPPSAEAVNISPIGQSFSGNYRVKFDMWINANGPFPGGGGGSTEFLTAGVGTPGDQVHNPGGAGAAGAWFGVSGEGGSSRDYRAYKGPSEQFPESGQYAAGAVSGANDSANAYYNEAFPGEEPPLAQADAFEQQTGFTSAGSTAFAWHEVTITRIANTVEWAIDGLVIATLDTEVGASFETEGNIFVGYMDIFPSVSDNAALSFGVVDNLTVSEIQVPSFMDGFDTDTSANWIVNRTSDDTAVEFAYDYSADGIPPAPGSADGSTLGVKFQANIADPASAEAINISPVGLSFTGDYRLEFDMWINANGPFPGGGGGSTEFLSAGIGTSGDQVQISGGEGVDGGWFAVTGEGGSSRDYRAYKGPGEQFPESGQFASGNVDGDTNNSNPYFHEAFPGATPPEAQTAAHEQQTGTTNPGAVAFEWHHVVISRVGDTVEWKIDDLVIATLDAGIGSSFDLDGNIFVGYLDAFPSVSDNPALSFGLVDNVQVFGAIGSGEVQIEILGLTLDEAGNAVIAFSVSGASPEPGDLSVQSRGDIDGVWADEPEATVEAAGDIWGATVPTGGAARKFYQIVL